MWTWAQLLPAAIWLVIIAIGGLYLSRRIAHRRTFLLALGVKVFLGLVVLPIYHQMPGQGDVLAYYHQSIAMQHMLQHRPEHTGAYLWAELQEEQQLNEAIAAQKSALPNTEPYLFLINNPAGNRMTRLVWLLMWPAMNSFWAVNLLFTILAFAGSWLLYRAWCRLLPGAEKILALTILLVPSLLFWTSGMGKDAIVMLGLGVGACLASLHGRWWLLPLPLLAIVMLRPNVMPVAVMLWLSQLALQRRDTSGGKHVPRYMYATLAVVVVAGLSILIWGSYGGFPLAQYPLILRYTLLQPGPVPEGIAVLQLDVFVNEWAWYLTQLPYALWGALVMPYPTQVDSPVQLAALLESWALLGSMLYLWYQAMHMRHEVPVRSRFVGIVLILAGLSFMLSIGLCVPYVGTMVRYRIYGWLLLLLGSLLCTYRPHKASNG